jgi:hypothetical protein
MCDAFTYPIDHLFTDRIHQSCHGHSELRADAGLNEKKASEIVDYKSTIVLLIRAKALTMCQTYQANALVGLGALNRRGSAVLNMGAMNLS